MQADQTHGHALNYQMCRYAGAKIMSRGPLRDPGRDYVAFIGGADTFGQFVPTAFPDLVERQTGQTCLNLGSPNAGIDAFLSDPSLMGLCARARMTVIQITGTQYMSNRFFTVDPRRNNRFIRASKLLKAIYFDVDFSRFETTDDMLAALASAAPDRLHLVRAEMQTAWVARMRSLIAAVDGPVILLWAADHPPAEAGQIAGTCRAPLFVNRPMLKALKGEDVQLVQVVASREEIAQGFSRMHLGEADCAAAVELLGPLVHTRIANCLSTVLCDASDRAAA